VGRTKRSGRFTNLLPVVVGIAGAADPYTATISAHLDCLGTVRGRLGLLATPSFLVYGTGGLAYDLSSLRRQRFVLAPYEPVRVEELSRIRVWDGRREPAPNDVCQELERKGWTLL
jgi:hypothetical protein